MAKSDSNQSLSDSQFMDRPADEILMNSLLRDYLKKVIVPDFESRILNKIDPRQSSSSRLTKRSFTEDELDEALGAAQADIEFGRESASRPPTKELTVVADSHWWEYKRVQRIAAAIGLAASLCFAYLGMTYLFFPTNDSLSGNGTGDASSLIANGSTADTNKTLPLTNDNKPSPELSGNPVPQLEPVPSSSVVETPVRVAENTEKKSSETRRRETVAERRMSRSEVAAVVDSQLDDIWKKFNVTPKYDSSLENWISRVTQFALGRMPTTSEREAIRLDKSENPRLSYVERLVDSDEFALHWGPQLAEHYLGTTLPMKRNRSSDQIRFVEWIESSIQQKRSLLDVEASLVSSSTSPNDPAAVWMKEAAKMGASIESSIASSTKMKFPHSKGDLSTVSVASTLLQRSGNHLVACTQCHSEDSKAMASLSGQMNDVRNFWSVPAAINTLVERRMGLLDPAAVAEKQKEFFFDDFDGKQVLAKPGVSFKEGGKVRFVSELEEWIRESTVARSGVVEHIWTRILHQPLVPVFGLAENEAYSERVDLKEMLSNQLHTSGSIQDLVASLLMSKAVGLAEAKLTTTWFLNASDDLLAQYHHSSRLFGFVPAASIRATNMTSGRIASWLQLKGNSTNPTLAQPIASKLKLPSKKVEADEVDKLLFLLSTSSPYSNLDRIAGVLAGSALTWDDQLNHTYLLMLGRYPTSAERGEAVRLLEAAGNDVKKTLVLVTTTILGSY